MPEEHEQESAPTPERHGQALRFEHIQDTIAAGPTTPSGSIQGALWEMLVFIAEEQMYQSRHFGKVLHHIERMEKHIMAADDAIFATLTTMGNDVAEMQAGVANLLVQIEHGNTQGAADEAAKIQAALDPLAASLRSAAAQFDPSPPAPAPNPDAPTTPRAARMDRNQQIAEAAKSHPAPSEKSKK